METENFLQAVEHLKAIKPLFDSDVNAYGIAGISVVAALVGAVAGYLPNMWLTRHHQKEKTKSTAYQIHAEIKATVTLAEHRGYGKGLLEIVDLLKKGSVKSYSLTVQIPDDRFLVYKANLAQIGLLPPKLQAKIVMLYQMMESISQDMKPGGFLNTPPANLGEFKEALELYESSKVLAKEVMTSLEALYPDLVDGATNMGLNEANAHSRAAIDS